MKLIMLISVMLLTMVTYIGNTYQSKYTEEQRLLQTLLKNYSINARPVKKSSLPVNVDVFMEIIRIDAVSEKGQSMRTIFHVLLEWKNELLSWEPSEFEGVDEIIIPRSKIWTPPISLFNEAIKGNGESTEQTDHMVSLSKNGNCSLSYAQFFKTTCEINVRFFPFDEHNCDMLFGSWGMDDRLLRLRSTNHNTIGKEYKINGEWELVFAVARDNQLKYSVQKRNHSIIKISMKIERKYIFFIMNLIIPCALIACMIFLVFVLPPKSGERIALAITVMLSMAIFQELSSEKLPTSSDNYPLLGIYYATSMVEIGLALCFNCFNLNLYYRRCEMKPWVRRIMFGRLARIVRVDVPETRTYEYLTTSNEQLCCEQPTTNESTINDVSHVTEVIENDVDRVGMKGDKTYFTASAVSREELGARNEQQRSSIERAKQRRKQFHRCRTLKNYEIDDHKLRAEHTKLLSEDWKLVARIMDRVMLTVSVIIGVLSVLIIFLQPPRVQKLFTS